MRGTFILLIFFLGFILLSSCNKVLHRREDKKHGTADTRGIVTNLTGIDGCGWVIKLDEKLADGTEKLEPVNLSAFDLALSEGVPVAFTYHKYPAASVCMVGKIVELEGIRILK